MTPALALLVLLAPTPSPSPAPKLSAKPAQTHLATPSPVPSEPFAERVAREQFAAWAAGKIDKSQYSIDVPQSTVEQLHELLPPLGAVKNVLLISHANMPQGSVYVYKFTCENGAALEQISLKDGKINGVYFRPAQ